MNKDSGYEYIEMLRKHDLYTKALPHHINESCLHSFASRFAHIKPKRILEIGRSAGFSMGFFAHAFPDAVVVSIDIRHNQVSDEIVKLLPNRCIQIIGTSKCLNLLSFKYDLVLIDGDHTFEGCCEDWNNVLPFLNIGSVVIFDDLDAPAGCGKVFKALHAYTKVIINTSSGEEGWGIVTID